MRQDSKILRSLYKVNRIAGMVPEAAARHAGYLDPHNAVKKIKKHTRIEEEVLEEIKGLSHEAFYTRNEVLKVTEEAINIARLGGDPGSMIRGVQEINKMQGFYAPETHRIELDVNQTIRVQQLQEMPESELLKRLGKDAAFIDAEFEELSTG